MERGDSKLVQVTRKENESLESLIRRFNRKIQQSGVLFRARKIRFYIREKSRNLQKVAARRRTASRLAKEELRKMGKLVPTKRFGRR